MLFSLFPPRAILLTAILSGGAASTALLTATRYGRVIDDQRETIGYTVS